MISVREAALRLGVSERTVQRWIESGRLRGRKLDEQLVTSQYVLDEDDVERFKRERKS